MFFEIAEQEIEDDIDENYECIQQYLQELRNDKEKFCEYYSKPFEDFLNYNPKTDLEKGFKAHLIKGLEIDFSIVNTFMPDQDIYDDGGIGFDMSFMIYMNHKFIFRRFLFAKQFCNFSVYVNGTIAILNMQV